MKKIEKLERRLSLIVGWAVYNRGKLLDDNAWDDLYHLLLIKSTVLDEGDIPHSSNQR